MLLCLWINSRKRSIRRCSINSERYFKWKLMWFRHNGRNQPLHAFLSANSPTILKFIFYMPNHYLSPFTLPSVHVHVVQYMNKWNAESSLHTREGEHESELVFQDSPQRCTLLWPISLLEKEYSSRNRWCRGLMQWFECLIHRIGFASILP